MHQQCKHCALFGPTGEGNMGVCGRQDWGDNYVHTRSGALSIDESNPQVHLVQATHPICQAFEQNCVIGAEAVNAR